MGIRIAERQELVHVPYGPPNHDGTSEVSFVDLKAHPEWVAMIPACIGWPETYELLKVLNARSSPYMSLATAQGYADPLGSSHDTVLTSFVTICYAAVARNDEDTITILTAELHRRVSSLLQASCDELQRSLPLEVLLERQPTVFHDHAFKGWSLSIYLTAVGQDPAEVRATWRIGMQALRDSVC